MGGVLLNGIQTPPARIFFEERGPGTPISNWTYDGPLGTLVPLPQQVLDFTTPPDTPRFVVWELATVVALNGNFVPFVVRVEKRARSFGTANDWDSYWIQLSIDGNASDKFNEYLQLSASDYSRYQAQTPGEAWTWFDSGLPTQTVSWTEAWPCAWDRTFPGPTFVPGL